MRRLSILSALIVLALSLGISQAQSETIILQVAVSNFAEDGVQAAVDAFEEQYPTIQVQLVDYDGNGMPANRNDEAESYQDDLLAYFQSADVVLVNNNMTVEATRAGYVLDLNPLTQSDPNYDSSMYHQSMTNAFKWDFGQWALPITSTFITTTYSPAAFDAAGLNYPTENWTLDDLIFTAQALTQYHADGTIAIPGLLVQGALSLEALLVSVYGQAVADDIAFPSVPAYEDVALADLLEQWYAFEAEGYTTLPADVDNDDVPLRISNPQQGGGGPNANNDTDTATALLPNASAGMNVSGYAVSAGTSYPMQAYNLALFLTQDANAIAVAGGTVAAIINAPDAVEGLGRGGNQTVNAAFEPLVDTAISNGIGQAEMRFAAGLGDALDLMASDALSAADALASIQDEQFARLVIADERAITTSLIVNPPEVAATIGAGEIALEFAVLAGGRGGGGVADTWETLAAEFVAQDAQVAQLTIEQAPPNAAAIPETAQCYYSASNLVEDLDLESILNLDPLLLSDPNYDPSDYVNGVLPQVQVDGVTYAIPISITPLVMRLDPNAFEQAGVPIPAGTWTVSEFEDALRQLTNVVDSGVSPLSLTGSTALINLIAIYGGQPFSFTDESISLSFTDPATVNAIQQVLDLAQDGLIAYSDGGNGGGGNQNTSPIIEQSLVGGGGFGGGNNPNNERVSLTFPTSTQGNAVSFDLGTMVISADSQNPDACYRFMSYVAQNADIFDTMPVTYSLLNSTRLLNAQGQETVDFYLAQAALLADPNTLALPSNINQVGFGMTQWLTGVFDAYLAGEVIDLESDLAIAQQRTSDYLTCVDTIVFDFGQGNGQGIRDELAACATAAST